MKPRNPADYRKRLKIAANQRAGKPENNAAQARPQGKVSEKMIAVLEKRFKGMEHRAYEALGRKRLLSNPIVFGFLKKGVPPTRILTNAYYAYDHILRIPFEHLGKEPKDFEVEIDRIKHLERTGGKKA